MTVGEYYQLLPIQKKIERPDHLLHSPPLFLSNQQQINWAFTLSERTVSNIAAVQTYTLYYPKLLTSFVVDSLGRHSTAVMI